MAFGIRPAKCPVNVGLKEVTKHTYTAPRPFTVIASIAAAEVCHFAPPCALELSFKKDHGSTVCGRSRTRAKPRCVSSAHPPARDKSCGAIMRMPGLPEVPASAGINRDGKEG